MQLPTLPTDNLYKFMTIIGLILLTIPAFLSRQLAPLDQEAASLTAALNISDADFERMKRVNNDDLNKLKERGPTPETIDALSQKIDERFRSHMKDYNALIVRGATLKSNVGTLKRESELYGWLVFPGAGLSVLGFIMWYFNHQRYQDIILKVQAKEATIGADPPQTK